MLDGCVYVRLPPKSPKFSKPTLSKESKTIIFFGSNILRYDESSGGGVGGNKTEKKQVCVEYCGLCFLHIFQQEFCLQSGTHWRPRLGKGRRREAKAVGGRRWRRRKHGVRSRRR